ncbi:SPFH domain-containing protein [Streptomyces enissocaesilis]|uniref:SPFH domain-containing protein n=1 Tax=Streptomyces enissocaesilis TaxID=332589 RepID=A0ABN3XI03_9ACTN
MSTTASETSEASEASKTSEEPKASGASKTSGAAGPVGAAGATGPEGSAPAAPERPDTRRAPVIRNETTIEIPVHLLFRDDTGPTALTLPPGATVIRRRKGAAERPRPERRAAALRPSEAVSPASVPLSGQVRSLRPATPADPGLSERPGPSLSGWSAVVVGAGALAAGAAAVWWRGVVPARAAELFGLPPRPYHGIGLGTWAVLAVLVLVVLFAFGGLGRGRTGYAWVLSLFGDYRGTVRRSGLVWVSPLLLRRRIDVRLRHWRSEPMEAVDANGVALRVVVLVVWRIRDTARAMLAVEDHTRYLREQVEAAMARVLSQLPADAFHDTAPTLRDAEAVGDALTRMLAAEAAPVGIEVFSAQPTRIEYAPEVAAAMRRRQVAVLDAQHRDSVLSSVVDAVDDTVTRLTSRGLVELDDYERKALVKDLTVAFYTGRGEGL